MTITVGISEKKQDESLAIKKTEYKVAIDAKDLSKPEHYLLLAKLLENLWVTMSEFRG